MTITRLMAVVGHWLYRHDRWPRFSVYLSYGSMEREASGKPYRRKS